jgi:hypothetical protein
MEYWGIKTWNRLLNGRCTDKIRILTELAGLSLRQTKILWLTFCQPYKLQSWQIADEMCMSERAMRKEKRKALELLQGLCEYYGMTEVKGDFFFELAERGNIPQHVQGWKPCLVETTYSSRKSPQPTDTTSQ